MNKTIKSAINAIVMEARAAADRSRDIECDGNFNQVKKVVGFAKVEVEHVGTVIREPERERPIAITWRLDHRSSGDLFAEFAAAVA